MSLPPVPGTSSLRPCSPRRWGTMETWVSWACGQDQQGLGCHDLGCEVGGGVVFLCPRVSSCAGVGPQVLRTHSHSYPWLLLQCSGRSDPSSVFFPFKMRDSGPRIYCGPLLLSRQVSAPDRKQRARGYVLRRGGTCLSSYPARCSGSVRQLSQVEIRKVALE